MKQTVRGEDVVEKQVPTATNKAADSHFSNRMTLYAVNVQPGGAGPPQRSAVEGCPPALVVLWAGTVSRVGPTWC